MHISNRLVKLSIECDTVGIHTYIRTYVRTYVRTYIPTYLHTYIPTYLHTYLHTYIPTYLHTYIPTYLHTYIPNRRQRPKTMVVSCVKPQRSKLRSTCCTSKTSCPKCARYFDLIHLTISRVPDQSPLSCLFEVIHETKPLLTDFTFLSESETKT